MVSIGIIQEYIADVNFAVLGYNIYYIFTKQEEKSNSSTNDNLTSKKSLLKYLDRLGDVVAEIEVLGETSIFRVTTRDVLTDEEIAGNQRYNTSVSSLKPGFIEKVVLASTAKGFQYKIHKQHEQSFLTPTDLKILRCLILNPQIGIADIANLISVSARTVNRILNKLRDNGVVRFSIICNPSLMKGFVVFGLLIYVNEKFKRSNSQSSRTALQ